MLDRNAHIGLPHLIYHTKRCIICLGKSPRYRILRWNSLWFIHISPAIILFLLSRSISRLISSVLLDNYLNMSHCTWCWSLIGKGRRSIFNSIGIFNFWFLLIFLLALQIQFGNSGVVVCCVVHILTHIVVCLIRQF